LSCSRGIGLTSGSRWLEESAADWGVKYEDTAEAPAGFGSTDAGPSDADASSSKAGTTAAVAVGASALVLGAVALAVLPAK
jgi:hypothetical protein